MAGLRMTLRALLAHRLPKRSSIDLWRTPQAIPRLQVEYPDWYREARSRLFAPNLQIRRTKPASTHKMRAMARKPPATLVRRPCAQTDSGATSLSMAWRLGRRRGGEAPDCKVQRWARSPGSPPGPEPVG